MSAQIGEKTRKRPSQKRSEQTVEAILKAAAHILIKEGYESANTNRIAEVAGVSIGSLYQYFPNRAAIISGLFEQHERQLIGLIQVKLDELKNEPLKNVVPLLIRAMVDMHRVNPKLHRILHEQTPGIGSRVDLEKFATEVVTEALKRRAKEIRPKNIDIAAYLIVTAVEAVSHTTVLHYPHLLNDDRYESEVVDLILSYLEK